MQPDFVPPKNEEEFQARAKTISTEGAVGVVNSLKARRAAMVRNLDVEIEFYERVIRERGATV